MNSNVVLLVIGALLAFAVPVVVSVVWTKKKGEHFTTALVGAACFLLFAIVLEKPIQNVLVFPVQMGLSEHAVSRFLNARPVLWAFVLGLFPGVFEETGRLVAFRTLLRKRSNRETAVTFGLGYGGFEVMMILGMTYVSYIAVYVLIKSGAYSSFPEEVMPQFFAIALEIDSFSTGTLVLAVAERVFAVLLHTGLSIMVFYACRDKKYVLYLLAVVLHTLLDFIACLSIPLWVIEIIVALFGTGVFLVSYRLLYLKRN